jgi:hypothetical protein
MLFYDILSIWIITDYSVEKDKIFFVLCDIVEGGAMIA